MKKYSSVRRSWRSALLVATVAMSAVAAIALPATASADVATTAAVRACPVYATTNAYPQPASCGFSNYRHHPYAGFSGWGTVEATQPACNFYGGYACPAYRIASVTAWRWNGSWSQQSLRSGEQVYIYPYAQGWSWVWTSRTGWLAAPDANVWVTDYNGPIAYAAAG